MGSRKGQAAIEYMMTHGWTILVLTAILIILYSMGIFSPSKYMREECYFQPDLHCESFMLKKGESGYSLEFTLNNGLGFDVLVKGINLTTTDLGESGEYVHSSSCPGACEPADGLVEVGEKLNVLFPIGGSGALPAKGTMHQMRVSIIYLNCKADPEYLGTPESCSGGSPHIVSGRIVANIE